MNRYSQSMQYVSARAEAEAYAFGKDSEQIEFYFLGLLKLAEVQPDEFLFPASPEFLVMDALNDIDSVKKMFREQNIDTKRVRDFLRHAIKHSEVKLAELGDYPEKARKIAEERGEECVYGRDFLTAILREPSAGILSVCSIKKELAGGNAQEADKPSAHEDEMTLENLPRLTARIRDMRAKLLNTVQGQDHVVHAFSEGMFAAEVLSASDEKRVRPRAIFVFAGPPGVGKTFLAEQAAEALELPYKRFDMSGFADHQSYMGLVGFEKSYRGAKPGTLTEFVKDNPHSILLFDEVEKAHLNTIHLFLQILDAGRLTDKFHDEDISFKDTIIIFTSNAGRSLYEGDAKQNAAGIPRKTIINALETEKNPQTGQPFFPAAITSRLATGWPLLFNHLKANDLEKISSREFDRFCALFKKQYGIEVSADRLLSAALLFKEGGQADARTLRAQTELFFKNEIFKFCRLWGEENFLNALRELKNVCFSVETANLDTDVRKLFFCDEKPEILLYGSESCGKLLGSRLPDYVIHCTESAEEALSVAGEKDIRLVLLDPAQPDRRVLASDSDFDPMATVLDDSAALLMSAGAFDFAPMASGAIKDGNRLFRTLRERLPELPVYLLETGSFAIDSELEMNFIRAGARGKLTATEKDIRLFTETLDEISAELYMQGAAARLAAEHKVLYFETAPKLAEDGKSLCVRLRDFSLKRATEADDTGSVLDDVEKPDIRFDDVIGAADAKDELKFFIDYLRNPRKFTAQGLKPPKGVLLYGPPGTGKTMLAKAMAGESDVAFIPAVASSFVTKWQGSGPEAVRELFKKARRYAPAILFIDEIDAVGRRRGEGNTSHGEEMALNALLTEMDGFSVDPKRPVFVLAATNFDVEEGQGGMGVIDPALSRRFDRKILVDLPNADDREKLLHLLLKKNTGNDVSDAMIRRTAERSMGMSPANLTSVVELAGRMAVKQGRPVDDAILDEAFELTKHGEKKDWGYEYLERVARHESGHAFLCYLGGNTPSYLTIVARGGHGGYMEHSAKEMGPLSTKEELLNRIRTSLGGRAAEIAYYGEEDGISTGASGDLEQATRMAAAMIGAYGMYEEYGLAAMDMNAVLGDAQVRQRVNVILGEEMRNTVRIISENKHRIDRMVDALMKKNKLTGEEMEELLKE